MAGRRDIDHDKPQLALKAATRDLIGGAGGTDGAAATVRGRQQRLSDCQHRNTGDFLRIDEAAKLEDVAIRTDSWPQVTRALADRQGFDLVRRVIASPSGADFGAALVQAVKEFSDVQQKIIAALPDGVTGAEILAGAIREEIAEAQRCLAQIDALCVRTVEGGE